MKKFMNFLGMVLFKVPGVGISVLVISFLLIFLGTGLISKWTNNNEFLMSIGFVIFFLIFSFFLILFAYFSDKKYWPKKSAK